MAFIINSCISAIGGTLIGTINSGQSEPGSNAKISRTGASQSDEFSVIHSTVPFKICRISLDFYNLLVVNFVHISGTNRILIKYKTELFQ